MVVTPTTSERGEEAILGDMLANVGCAQAPTAVGSAGKPKDIPSAVPAQEASVAVEPAIESFVHSTAALEPPAENTMVAVTPAPEIPVRRGRIKTTTEPPSERPVTPVEVPMKEAGDSECR